MSWEQGNLQGDLHQGPAGSVSLPSSVFLLCATTLGAGLLAIPGTFSAVGIGLGIICLVVFGFFTWYSIFMLLKSGEHLNVRNYEDLVARAFPQIGRVGTTILMNVLIFGALTGFVVIIGDVVMPLVNRIPISHGHRLVHSPVPSPIPSPHSPSAVSPIPSPHVFALSSLPLPSTIFFFQKPFVTCVLVVIIVLPLCLLRRISFLEPTSYLAVGIIVFFAGIVLYNGIVAMKNHTIMWHELKYFDFGYEQVFSALPIISLAYTCQLTVFPIWKELYDPTLGRMNTVVVTMALIAFTLYSVVGLIGFALYPTSTPSNIILALPDTIFYDVIRAIFGIAIICHYPVVHYAFRNSIEVTFFSNYQFNIFRHVLVTILTVAASTACALLLPSLGAVFDLTGSFAAFPICFIIPSLVYLKVMFWESGTESSELDPLLKDTKFRRGTPLSRLMTGPAILAMVTLVVTVACCAVSIYVSILEVKEVFFTKN